MVSIINGRENIGNFKWETTPRRSIQILRWY